MPMFTKMTLYNYSITSLYSMHVSAQSSYKNKNVLKILPSGFFFLLQAAFNLTAFTFQSKIFLAAFQKQWSRTLFCRFTGL